MPIRLAGAGMIHDEELKKSMSSRQSYSHASTRQILKLLDQSNRFSEKRQPENGSSYSAPAQNKTRAVS